MAKHVHTSTVESLVHASVKTKKRILITYSLFCHIITTHLFLGVEICSPIELHL